MKTDSSDTQKPEAKELKMTFSDEKQILFHENSYIISEELARERWGDEEVDKLIEETLNV